MKYKTFVSYLLALTVGLTFGMGVGYMTSEPPVHTHVAIEESLYVRVAAVYSGNVDNRFNMTYEAMVDASASFVNRPVLMGHDWRDPNAAVGVIKAAVVKYDKDLKRYYIEMIFEIKSAHAISMIKKGLFSNLSIGFVSERTLCPLDGQEMSFCQHVPGRYYKEGDVWRLARGIVKKIVGKEVSFINVPASDPARVLEWSHTPLSLASN